MRRVPPLGIEVSESDKAALQGKLDVVASEIELLKKELAKEPKFLELLPDVGPIDDAFMDSFFMVRPTGDSLNDDDKNGRTVNTSAPLFIGDSKCRGTPALKMTATSQKLTLPNTI